MNRGDRIAAELHMGALDSSKPFAARETMSIYSGLTPDTMLG